MSHPWFSGHTPRVLAHRGFVPDPAEGIVENSFAALAAANAANAEYVESDCHLTRDGEVVLFHDADLARVIDDPRMLRDVEASELEEIMSDRGGLVTLQQAIEAFPDTRFNIDVKSDEAAVPAGRIVARAAERVLLTSFSDARRRVALTAAAEARPEQRPATSAGSRTVALLLAAVTLGARHRTRALLDDIDAVQVPERRGPLRIVTRRFVEAVHEAGAEVHVWTVNDEDDMRRLVALGVDGIVTDRADVALQVLG